MTFITHATAADAWNAFLNRCRELGVAFDTDLSPTDRLASAFANFILPDSPAAHYYVDTVNGSASNNGLSWTTAFSTMAAALAAVSTGGTIHFRGDVREELTGSNLVFDVTIIGHGSLHHADVPDTGYHPGSCIWRPPASPTATTPLLKLRARGWKFINIMFDCPVDSAAIYMERNALSGTSEYDPSHATFINCRFVDGKYGIQDVGGCYNVTLKNCEFKACTTAAIANTSTAVANPLNWKIIDCLFPANVSSFGNATHIDSPLNASFIKNCEFGTVTSTALYVDLTGGNVNFVTGNKFGGSYDTSDYVAGTDDNWSGNITADISSNSAVADNGLTIAVPAAP